MTEPAKESCCTRWFGCCISPTVEEINQERIEKMVADTFQSSLNNTVGHRKVASTDMMSARAFIKWTPDNMLPRKNGK
jgi:hypothetical protein